MTIDFSAFDIFLTILMPLLVAAFLIWYSMWAERKGWISYETIGKNDGSQKKSPERYLDMADQESTT